MSKPNSIKVGFVLSEIHLLGVRNYLRNLFAAINTLPGKPIDLVLFAGKNQRDVLTDFPGVELVQSSILDRKSAIWFTRKLLVKITGRDLLLQKLLQRNNVSVLSHSSHLGRQRAIKTIGWIADFQHQHLPEFYSLADRSERDKTFTNVCDYCDAVFVSSEYARTDLRTHSPTNAHKAELLRFIASPLSQASAASLSDLKNLYNFDSTYFLLPNQFWAHKNHRVVINALRILKQRNQHLLVLATGLTRDHRDATYFPSLMKHAAECDVLDLFRVLGVIPYDHLIGLMKNAVAFINPSKFEGWSTTVEEAKTMGKQIILSDIPVHLEQAPDRGYFFPVDNPEALADSMIAALSCFEKREDDAMQERARFRHPERMREYGETYRQVIMKIIKS